MDGLPNYQLCLWVFDVRMLCEADWMQRCWKRSCKLICCSSLQAPPPCVTLCGLVPVLCSGMCWERWGRWVGNVSHTKLFDSQLSARGVVCRSFRRPARSATLGFWCLCYSCSSWSPVLVRLTLVGLSILFILICMRCLQRALWWQTVAIADVQPS